MTVLTSPLLRVAAAAALAFALTLFVLSAGEEPAAGPSAPALDSPRRPDAGTDAQIRRLQAEARRAPGAARPRIELAAAYLQKARETPDPALYARAERLLRGVPRTSGALVELGALALARHDFRRALALGREANGLAAMPVLVDALVELGRYDEAERTLQRFVDLKPGLAAYTRVSYLRELHGNLPGAAGALRLAIAAGGPVTESSASASVLLGDLELARGRRAAAARAYAAALAAVPGYAPAEAGRARLAAHAGDVGLAIRRWRRLVARLPLPEYAIALGEAELAAGRPSAARRSLELARLQLGTAARGTDVNLERSLFEADHGDPSLALRLARRAWTAAPSVRSADAIGWALTRSGRTREGRAWARRALRLGSVDPLFHFHAGNHRFALAHGLRAHPWHARQARRAVA